MEIVQYIKWTKSGEKDRFFQLIKDSKNDIELKDFICKEFGVEGWQAGVMMSRFSEKIKSIRNKK